MQSRLLPAKASGIRAETLLNRIDMNTALKLTTSLEACLQALRRPRTTLVAHPNMLRSCNSLIGSIHGV